jgi:predicted chitinase
LAPANAANDLQRKIQANEEFFVNKYSRATTIAQFGHQADQFKLHDSKVSYYLINYLESKGLAWRGPDWEWIFMHPRLGTAVMSVISLAIAQSDGLDIVTPSDRTHYFASLSDENEIFANLLEYKPAREIAFHDAEQATHSCGAGSLGNGLILLSGAG